MQTTPADYDLGDQIGFVLRRAFQRHTAIFQARMVAALTPTQFAAMVRLADVGPCSQNLLGRLTAMDVATIKGVIDRLRSRGLVASVPDETDRRRSSLTLTPAGRRLLDQAIEAGRDITRETLSPLNPQEQRQLLNLLGRITD
ncbi:MAG: MarR family winged helix-turn-helix transcriptional regulator [Burkholderiaceae bacterium]